MPADHRARVVGLLMVGVVCLGAQPAAAGPMSGLGNTSLALDLGPPPGVWSVTGLGLAAAVHGYEDEGDGMPPTLVLESSLARLDSDDWFVGGYVDTAFDFSSESARISLGPEIGYSLFGVDGGYVLSIGYEGQVDHGVTVRLFVTCGYFVAYGRVGHLFGGAGHTWSEWGFLLKLPIRLDT